MPLREVIDEKLLNIALSRNLPVPREEYSAVIQAVESLDEYVNGMTPTQRVRAGLAIMLGNLNNRVLLERIALALEREDQRLGRLVLEVHDCIMAYQRQVIEAL